MNVADCSEMQLDLFEICGVPVGDRLQDFSFGKTCPERLAVTKDWILEPCLKRSQRPRFQCLRITNGQTPEWSNGMAVRLPGECLTRNIGASPNVAVESFLSQILQDTVPEKYYLSARACEGILRRAERREKDLPTELKVVLEAQASYGCAPDAPGGGKGALVSRERSLTLAANTNDQVLFVPDKARSLTARADGSPCVDRGPDIIAAGFKAGNGPTASIGYAIETAATLTAECSGTQRPTVAVYDMTHADEVFVESSFGAFRKDTVAGAQKESGGGMGGGSETLVCQKTVRRLTPLEAERLQGLEDNYTLIDDKTCSDTARYKALGNGMAQPVANWVIKRIKEVVDGDGILEKGAD